MIARPLLAALVRANDKLKLLAIHLVKWTGKSRDAVHPKHLLGDDPAQYWYLAYCAPGTHVLDLGCGHGMHALKVATRVRWVEGVDRDPAALAMARRAAVGWHNVSFIMADCEAPLPYAAALFDTVLCLDLLEHVVARGALLAEIRRVLKPEGTLLLAVPNRATSWKRRLERAGCFAYSDPDHKTEYTLAELGAELGRNGFHVAAFHPAVYDTPLIGLIDVVGGLSLTVYGAITRLRRRLAQRYPEESAGFFAVCKPTDQEAPLMNNAYDPIKHSIVQLVKDPWQSYDVPMYVEALLFHLFRAIAVAHWNVYQENWNHWDADPGVPGIAWQAYVTDCECPEDEGGWIPTSAHVEGCKMLAPNFEHEDTKFNWYKNPGRGMSTNQNRSPQEWVDWFNRCLVKISAFNGKHTHDAEESKADRERVSRLRGIRQDRRAQEETRWKERRERI